MRLQPASITVVPMHCHAASHAAGPSGSGPSRDPQLQTCTLLTLSRSSIKFDRDLDLRPGQGPRWWRSLGSRRSRTLTTETEGETKRRTSALAVRADLFGSCEAPRPLGQRELHTRQLPDAIWTICRLRIGIEERRRRIARRGELLALDDEYIHRTTAAGVADESTLNSQTFPDLVLDGDRLDGHEVVELVPARTGWPLSRANTST